MSEVELGLEVELDVDVLVAVLGLPPAVPAPLEGRHDVLDAVAPLEHVGLPRLARVALEALRLLLQVADHAVPLGAGQAAGGGGVQLLAAADQQVSRRRVAAALFTSGLPRAQSTCNLKNNMLQSCCCWVSLNCHI